MGILFCIYCRKKEMEKGDGGIFCVYEIWYLQYYKRDTSIGMRDYYVSVFYAGF